MLRLILFLIAVALVATGLSWLADRPGEVAINWQGYRWDPTVFQLVVGLAILITSALVVWSILRHLWESPAAVGRHIQRRRQSRGLDALSSGMIAIGAGDRDSAARYALQARKALPNEPLTHLLRAQAAQLTGDKATSRRIFEGMLSSPDTEQLGLRGLYLEALRETEAEAAIQFAARALKVNPKLEWAAGSLFELQCKRSDWQGAMETLSVMKKNRQIEKQSADRRRAVLLTAQSLEAEDGNQDKALNLALEAHALAPDLIPASAISGRLLASRGNTPRAAKVIQKTWKKSPHPDLAVAFAHARLGDSPRDRLERVQKLAGQNPHSIESPIAVATAAIEAKDFGAARRALEPLIDGRLTQRVCTLMAVIESESHGNKGRIREWLARAVNAPRDPAWTADGVVSENWAPVSPVSGALDAFQWRVPVEAVDSVTQEIIASRLEALVALGATSDVVASTSDVAIEAEEVVETKNSDGAKPMSDPSKKATRAGHEDEIFAPDDNIQFSKDIADLERRKAPSTSEDVNVETGSPKQVASMALAKDDEEEWSRKNVELGSPENDAGIAKTDRDTSRRESQVTAHSYSNRKEMTKIRTNSYSASPMDSESTDGTLKSISSAGADTDGRASRQKPTVTSKKRDGFDGSSTASDSRIFVSPRAPDDPGPEAVGETDQRRPPANPYRRSPG